MDPLLIGTSSGKYKENVLAWTSIQHQKERIFNGFQANNSESQSQGAQQHVGEGKYGSKPQGVQAQWKAASTSWYSRERGRHTQRTGAEGLRRHEDQQMIFLTPPNGLRQQSCRFEESSTAQQRTRLIWFEHG